MAWWTSGLPAEYSGELLSPPNQPHESSQSGEPIPVATKIPWVSAVNESDGTIKSVEELREIYGGQDITRDKETIVYCRNGERSSRT